MVDSRVEKTIQLIGAVACNVPIILCALLIGFAEARTAAQSAPPRKDIPAISKAANGAAGYFSNKLICLDGVVNTVETPFLHLDSGGCTLFVVRFPLSPEDADLLTGRIPKDDD